VKKVTQFRPSVKFNVYDYVVHGLPLWQLKLYTWMTCGSPKEVFFFYFFKNY